MNIVALVANIAGFTGVLILGFSTLRKNRRSILKLNALGDIFYALAGFLIGSPAAMVVNIAAFFRDGLGYLGRLTALRNFLLTGTGVVVGLLANTRGVWGFLPLIATSEYAICLALAHRPQTLRLALTINLSLWIAHDLAVGLYAAAAVDAVSISIMLYGLAHFYQQRRRIRRRARKEVKVRRVRRKK